MNLLLPSTELNGQSGSQLGEFQHVVEGELVRNIDAVARIEIAAVSPT